MRSTIQSDSSSTRWSVAPMDTSPPLGALSPSAALSPPPCSGGGGADGGAAAAPPSLGCGAPPRRFKSDIDDLLFSERDWRMKDWRLRIARSSLISTLQVSLI